MVDINWLHVTTHTSEPIFGGQNPCTQASISCQLHLTISNFYLKTTLRVSGSYFYVLNIAHFFHIRSFTWKFGSKEFFMRSHRLTSA